MVSKKSKEIPMTAEISATAPQVKVHHADRCDRIIIVSAIVNNYDVVSPDHLIRGCDQLKVVW